MVSSSLCCHWKHIIIANKERAVAHSVTTGWLCRNSFRRGVATHVLFAQRQATQLLRSASYIRSNQIRYGKTREILDVFRAYQADDETSVHLSLDLMKFVVKELHRKYSIRKKTCRYSRARFIYHPLYWRPLLQNWKNAVLKRRNVPHPIQMRDYLLEIALKLPGFDCSEGLCAILSVLSSLQQSSEQSFSTASLSTKILEEFLDFCSSTNHCPKPHASVFHEVLLAWSRVSNDADDCNNDQSTKLRHMHHIVSLMENHQVQPYAPIYNVFLQYYREQKDRQAFQQKLDELMRNNIRPNPDTIQLVRTSLEHDDPWKKKFLYYVAVMQDPDEDDDDDDSDDQQVKTGDEHVDEEDDGEEEEGEVFRDDQREEDVTDEIEGEEFQHCNVHDPMDDSIGNRTDPMAVPSSSSTAKTEPSMEMPLQQSLCNPIKPDSDSEAFVRFHPDFCHVNAHHDREMTNTWTISTQLLESLRVAVVNDREAARNLVDCAQLDWGRRIAQKEIHYQLNDEYCQIMTEVYQLAIEHVHGDELKHILKRDAPSCAILMKAYARLGDFDSADEIFFRLVSFEKLTNNVIFNILIDIWAESNAPEAFERAIRVIEQLEIQGLNANRKAYHALLKIADQK